MLYIGTWRHMEGPCAYCLVQRCQMCGTEVPVFLCAAGGERMCGSRQTYVRLEPNIENQPILYRQMPYPVLINAVSCTNNRFPMTFRPLKNRLPEWRACICIASQDD